jgi:hypothetical protein
MFTTRKLDVSVTFYFKMCPDSKSRVPVPDPDLTKVSVPRGPGTGFTTLITASSVADPDWVRSGSGS